jgi:hypothetical protein
MENDDRGKSWINDISPLKLSLLVVNAVCFGGFIVFLALGKSSGPLVGMTVATGLMLFAGLAGALMASRRVIKQKLISENQ